MLRILSIAALAAVLLAPVPASAFTIGFGPFRLSIPIGVGPSYRHVSRSHVRTREVRHVRPTREATRHPSRTDPVAPATRVAEPTTMSGN
jgi:hypothetical protein